MSRATPRDDEKPGSAHFQWAWLSVPGSTPEACAPRHFRRSESGLSQSVCNPYQATSDTSCNTDDNDGGNEVNPNEPDFALWPSPTSCTINYGGTSSQTTFDVSAAFSNGFAGLVSSFRITGGLPAGVIGSFSPSSVTASGGLTTLTLTIGSGVADGSYTFTVAADGSVGTRTAQASLAVVNGTFTLSVWPPMITVVRPTALQYLFQNGGWSSTANVSVQPTATFSQSIALSSNASSLGSWLKNETFTPGSLTSGQYSSGSSFKVRVNHNAPITPQNAPLAIQLTGTAGAQAANTTVYLCVKASSGSPDCTVSPSYNLSASPATITASVPAVGQTATSTSTTISLSPYGGFNENVTLSANTSGIAGVTTQTWSPTDGKMTASLYEPLPEDEGCDPEVEQCGSEGSLTAPFASLINVFGRLFRPLVAFAQGSYVWNNVTFSVRVNDLVNPGTYPITVSGVSTPTATQRSATVNLQVQGDPAEMQIQPTTLNVDTEPGTDAAPEMLTIFRTWATARSCGSARRISRGFSPRRLPGVRFCKVGRDPSVLSETPGFEPGELHVQPTNDSPHPLAPSPRACSFSASRDRRGERGELSGVGFFKVGRSPSLG